MCRQKVNATDALSPFILPSITSDLGFVGGRLKNNDHRSCFVTRAQQYGFSEHNRNARLRLVYNKSLNTS